MPELREVFQMTTKQIEPDVDAWREQERHQRRSGRNKKIGAFAVAAAIGLAAVIIIVVARPGTETTTPGTSPSPTGLPRFSTPSLVNLRAGDVTSLPGTTLGSQFYSTSPDRTMFVYSRCCSSPNPVFVANVDGTGVRPITPDGVDGFGARWSPDGSTVVYQRRDGATLEIGNLVVVDVGSGETTQITNLEPAFHGWWFMAPSFSPDGQTIIFHMPRGRHGADTRWDVWSVPVAGGDPTLVVADASRGVFAPNGEQLTYLDSPRGFWSSSRLMVADADGGDPRVLVEGNKIDGPQWSPNGTRIAYTDAGRTYVVDVATGETSLVAAVGEVVADWFDEDTLVIVPAG
jgi:Tol biopolymer transport system component